MGSKMMFEFSGQFKNNLKIQRILHWLLIYVFLNGLIFIIIELPLLIKIISSLSFKNFSIFKYGNEQLIKYGFTFINYWSYFLFLSMMLGLLCSILLIFYKLKKTIKLLIILPFATASIFLYADQIVFSLYKFHLNLTVLNQFFMQFNLILSQTEIFYIIAIIILAFLGQLFIAYCAEKLKPYLSKKSILTIFLVNLFLLGYSFFILSLSLLTESDTAAQQTNYLPLYNFTYSKITSPFQKNFKLEQASQKGPYIAGLEGRKINYPSNSPNCRIKNTNYSILLILVDTLRADSFNQSQMPNLYKRKKLFSIFNNHWSGGNATQSGVFSLLYSLAPSYWDSTVKYNIEPSFNSILRQRGYNQSAFISSDINAIQLHTNAFIHFDNIYSAASENFLRKPNENDQLVTSKILDTIKKSDRPFFIFTLLDSVHGVCAGLDVEQIFKPAVKSCERFKKLKLKNIYQHINQYKNTVYYTDKLLENIFTTLDKEKKWDNTVVIITSDHGEEFNDNGLGYWGHASNYTKYQLKVPLLIHWPGKPNVTIEHKTSHYDIIPTFFEELLGCPTKENTSTLGSNIYYSHKQPFLIAGSYVNNAIITNNNIFVLSSTGNIQAQDLSAQPINKMIDPELFRAATNELTKLYS